MSTVESTVTQNEGSYLSLVEALCTAHAHPINAPVIITDSPFHSAMMKWIVVSFPESSLPTQGWKLHIAAQHYNANLILERVVPILVRHQTPFKCAPSRLKLQGLNQGEGGMTQIGKFITIYPLSDEQAVALAQELSQATSGLEGPSVPSDRPLAPDSLVHYRYGSFTSVPIQTQMGQIYDALRMPDGSFVKDKRDTRYHAPAHIPDPFEAAGVVTPLPQPKRLYGGRFLHISTIYQAPRNTIHITVDIEKGQRAIVKQVSLKMRVGANGKAATDFLRNEAAVLQAVGHDSRFPAFYALFENDNSLFLAMEDIEAVTFERFIASFRTRHELPGTAEVVRWGRDIASMLSVMHRQGWVHRDLKSTNVLVTKTGTLRLIDFDISSPIGSDGWGLGFGTRGYMSVQQSEGAPTSVQDDIHGLGGLLYFAATLTETSQSPNIRNILERPVEWLNPRISPRLRSVIERCLAPNTDERFATMDEVEQALAHIDADEDVPLDPTAFSNHRDIREYAAPEFQAYAIRLAESLLKSAKPVLEGAGLAWVSAHGDGGGVRSREINTGSSGTLYALTEFADKLGVASYEDAVARGAHWLTIAPRISEPMVPGLYVGEAGIAAALLRAGQVLRDDALVTTALTRANDIAATPLTSPDLFNGAAGRLRLHLWAWRATGDPLQLAHAQQAGDFLVDTVQSGADDEAYWTIPQGFDGLSGHTYIGYSHGAAGIADALLDLYEATANHTYRTLVERAARWVIKQGVPVLDGAGVAWSGEPHQGEGTIPIKSPFWCHGAAGIGLFLVRVAQSGILPAALESAFQAARAVAYCTRWSNPTHCHGLAGNIDFLITVYQATGDTTYLDHAYTLGKILTAFVQQKDGLWVASSETSGVVTPDYMVGYAGVAVTLLRLSMPDTFSHPFRDETIQVSVPSAALV